MSSVTGTVFTEHHSRVSSNKHMNRRHGGSELHHPGNKIYGRRREIELLQDAFNRVKGVQKSDGTFLQRTGRSEVMVVHGQSGTGKTRLVDCALRTYVAECGGNFVSGKFDQMRRTGELFSALAAALSDLCDLLLQAWNEGGMRKLQDGLRQELGSEAKILTKIIPNLSCLLPELRVALGDTSCRYEKDVLSGRGKNALTRLGQLCRTFLRVVATPSMPLVLFLDDVQWADEASLELIRGLATDSNSKHILLITSFRTEDAADDITTLPSNNQMGMTYKDLSNYIIQNQPEGTKNITKCELIEVENLDIDGINDMISARVSRNDEETRGLSHVILHKTHGNPFFIEQFLGSLQRLRLLQEVEAGRWQWNLVRIQTETNVCKNVVDLVAGKVEMLPTEVQDVLKVASYLGHTFDVHVLERVDHLLVVNDETQQDQFLFEVDTKYDESDSARTSQAALGSVSSMPIKDVLHQAVETGLVEQSASKMYKFSHDRVQQCLFSMIGEGYERTSFHLKLGRELLTYWREGVGETSVLSNKAIMLLATDHLNHGSVLMKEPFEKVNLVDLNVEASSHCLQQCSFGSSAEYIRHGLRLLDELSSGDKWDTHYDQTLILKSKLGLSEFCIGNFKESNAVCAEVIRQAKCIEDKMDTYATIVKCLGFQEERLSDAVQLGLAVSRMLGERFPKKVKVWHVMKELMNARKAIRKLSDDDFLNLPPAKNHQQRLFDVLVTSTVNAFSNEQSRPYFAILSCRTVKLTCLYGSSDWTAAVLAWYGGIEVVVGNREAAGRFLRLSTQLMERSTSKVVKARCLASQHGLLSQWFHTLPVALRGFEDAYMYGMECGDYGHGLFGACQYLSVAFHHQKTCVQIESDARIFCQQMREFNLRTGLNLTRPIWQSAMNLVGDEVDEPYRLSGDVMDDEELLIEMKGAGSTLGITILRSNQLKMANHFDHWDLMEEFYDATVRAREENLKGHCTNFFATHQEGTVSFKLYEYTGKRKYRGKALRAARMLEKWHKDGVENCAVMAMDLRMQSVAMHDKKGRKKEQVVALIDEALELAIDQKLFQVSGSICERASRILRRVYNDREASLRYIRKGIEIYENWEAYSKVEWLKKIHSQWKH